MSHPSFQCTIIAVDVGNSNIALGRFDPTAECEGEAQRRLFPIAAPRLPEPVETLDLPLFGPNRSFDERILASWRSELPVEAKWLIASVCRSATDNLVEQLENSPISHVLGHDIELSVDIEAPDRIGIDRLLAAYAVNQLRPESRPAIVVDHGSAITVDLVTGQGSFAGGAILPGRALAARVLAEGTDALPLVDSINPQLPQVIGVDTESAIASGLHWGTIGAVRELMHRIATSLQHAPRVFVTGGGAAGLAEELQHGSDLEIRRVPHLVLSGLALVGQKMMASDEQ